MLRKNQGSNEYFQSCTVLHNDFGVLILIRLYLIDRNTKKSFTYIRYVLVFHNRTPNNFRVSA